MGSARTRTVRWRALDWPGWEHLELSEEAAGVIARGVLIGAREGFAYGASYEARLTADWVFRAIEIRRTDGQTFALRSDGAGSWTDATGAPMPGLAGCIDIDLSGSPFTNTLPVRRAEFEDGRAQSFRMAWIPLDTLRPFADRQCYTRLAPRRFRYGSGDGSFERVIEFDEDLLVADYPGLFVSMPIQ